MSYSLSAILKRLFLRRPLGSRSGGAPAPNLEALEDRYAPAVLTVLNTADSGANSLRAVVSNANTGDTINFDPSLKNQTIVLATGQINITKSLTIDGQNYGVRISSDDTSRVFYNSDDGLTETISNLTFFFNTASNNGAGDLGNGGAIYDLGKLTLNSDTFTENTAAGSGGAVYNAGGQTLTADGCTFTSNLSNTGYGGAICVDFHSGDPGVTVRLRNNCIFTDNHAFKLGGAVYATGESSTDLFTTNSSFTNNSTTTTGLVSSGGAIYTTDELAVIACVFAGNTATGYGGGAIYFLSSPASTSDHLIVTLSNDSFTNNTAGHEGGAVADSANASQGSIAITISGCLFSGNRVGVPGGFGGGLYVADVVSAGGDIVATVGDSTFYRNVADDGGGIAVAEQESNDATDHLSLTSLTVASNTANSNGGGLYLSPATSANPSLQPFVANTIIAGNSVPANTGTGPDAFGSVNSYGYNLIGKTDGSTGWLSRISDQLGTIAAPLDPGLDAAGPTNNGGTTLTIKLANGSKAYRTGEPLFATSGITIQNTDQRGYIRQKNEVSIGAYDPDAIAKKVGALPTSTSVASSVDPSITGQTVLFIATVTGSDGGTPSGTATFMDDYAVLGTVTLSAIQGGSQATFSTSSLPPGENDIEVAYSGDSTYDSSTADDLNQLVYQATSTSLASNLNPAAPGQSVTFQASVMAYDGTPTGTMTFLDGQTVLGTVAVTPGGMGAQATFTTSALSLGSHLVTAVYGGDQNFAGSTSSVLTENVQLLSTFTSLSSSANPSTPGQSITLTGSVTGYGGATPTGSIQFFDGPTLLATVAVTPGGMGAQASFSTTGLSLGSHSLQAVYSGDGSHAASTSSVLTQTVQLAQTYTSLSSSANPSPYGSPVTFTATIMGRGSLSGTVSFYDGTTLLATVNVSNNTATYTTSVLLQGSHSITAVFSGDADDLGSTSSVLDETIQ